MARRVPSASEVENLIFRIQDFTSALSQPLTTKNAARLACLRAEKCAAAFPQPSRSLDGIHATYYTGWPNNVIRQLDGARALFLRIIDALGWRNLIEGSPMKVSLPVRPNAAMIDALSGAATALKEYLKSEWRNVISTSKTASPPRKTKRRKADASDRKLKALAVLRDHPDWSDREIANAVGLNHGQLSRDRVYQQAKAQFKRSPRHGFRKASGAAEAVVEPDPRTTLRTRQ